MLLLFVLTAPGGRVLLRQPWSWRAAAVGLGLYSSGAYRTLTLLTGGTGIHCPRYFHNLTAVLSVVLPSWDFGGSSCNAFLNHYFTPPVFYCAPDGPWWRPGGDACLAARSWPWGAGALLLTWVGLVGGGMNTACVQLPAMPLYDHGYDSKVPVLDSGLL